MKVSKPDRPFLSVSVLSQAEEPLPGFGHDNFILSTHNVGGHQECVWSGHSELSALFQQIVHLEFRVQGQARLFGFEIV